jgi:hypothetical protein
MPSLFEFVVSLSELRSRLRLFFAEVQARLAAFYMIDLLLNLFS